MHSLGEATVNVLATAMVSILIFLSIIILMGFIKKAFEVSPFFIKEVRIILRNSAWKKDGATVGDTVLLKHIDGRIEVRCVEEIKGRLLRVSDEKFRSRPNEPYSHLWVTINNLQIVRRSESWE